MKTLTAVLFVGGESRRMGADKATLMIDGEPLWSRQLRSLRELRPEKILISARSRPAWCPPEIEVVLDKVSGLGPLAGLQASLEKATTTHLLTLAVDLPLMTSNCLGKIFACTTVDSGAVVKNNFYEPLCAVYPVNHSVQTIIAELAKADNRALQTIIECLVAKNWMRPLPHSDFAPGVFTNVNAMDELRLCSGDCL